MVSNSNKGLSYSGSIPVSKTVDRGSNPRGPAKKVIEITFCEDENIGPRSNIFIEFKERKEKCMRDWPNPRGPANKQ